MNTNNIYSNDTETTGRWLWGFQSVDVLVIADPLQVDMKLEGNIFANFLNLFHSMYLPLIISVTEESMAISLMETLPDIINYYPEGIDGYIEAFDKSMPHFQPMICDLDTSLPITIENEYVGLTGRGLWFHSLQGRRNMTV